MRKNTYIGIAFIVLVFGIIFIPRIFRRYANDDVVRGGRMHAVGESEEKSEDELLYITINNKEKIIWLLTYIKKHGSFFIRFLVQNRFYRG